MSPTLRILIGLVLGLGLGIALAAAQPAWQADTVAILDALGGVWLDALRMTIVPLVFALLVTGVAQAAGTLAAGGIAGRTLLAFGILLLVSALVSALVGGALLDAWPPSASATAALKAAEKGAGAVPPTPPFAEWLRSFVPNNAIKAAAEGAMAPLVFFALVFGLAATRIEDDRRERLFGFFDAVQAAMMVIVRWVLWAAPAGVFALGVVFGARTGVAGLGVLVQYVIVVSLMCLLAGLIGLVLGIVGGRIPAPRMLAALIPVSAVAISTQSSLASLPTMLEACEKIGVTRTVRDLVMPMAVALYRMTSPAGNVAVALYVAHVYGIHLDPLHVAAGVIVAALVSLAAVGIASAVTFFTTLGPIFMAMGLPMELLPLLLAVETLPDLSRTIGNVAADVGVTAFMDRWTGRAPPGKT
ncbi:MAG: cation:dicarboxylase symporter family transporter [Proteobacteria bacterium]|nr:cation:dicarboxylase symporter family transporter [Pseudomonadota bacterium]